MKKYEINGWKESANESLNQNVESVKKNGVFYFSVTVEQKEYLEKHINLIDEWCKNSVGEETTAIRFEKDWDGMQECYTCECYFEKWYNLK